MTALVDAIGSLDEEELRIRSLQGAGGVHFTPVASIMAPQGISSVSSIGPAEKREVPQHRPALPTPRQNVMIDVLGAHRETERLMAKGARVFDEEIVKSMADVDKLAAERQEALENEAKNVKARTTWSTLSIVAQYISGIGLIALGWACGGLPAFLLIAAGGVGIVNRVIHDTNFLQAAVAWWTKSVELQQKIVRNIEMGAFFLQMGLGLAGGFAAWQTGALAAAHINSAIIKEKLVSTITGAAGVLSMGAKVGSSHYDKKIAYIQARMKEIDAQTNIDHLTMYNDSIQISKMVDSTQSQTEELRKAIRAQEVPQD